MKSLGERERFHAIISWEKKAKPDLGKVCLNLNLFDAGTSKPKNILNLHEMGFCTVCIFRNFSFLFTVWFCTEKCIPLILQIKEKSNQNFKYLIDAPDERVGDLVWPCALNAEWTHSQEDKSNPGCGQSHHPQKSRAGSPLRFPGIRLVHTEVKADSGQRLIFTTCHFPKAFLQDSFSSVPGELVLSGVITPTFYPHFLHGRE